MGSEEIKEQLKKATDDVKEILEKVDQYASDKLLLDSEKAEKTKIDEPEIKLKLRFKLREYFTAPENQIEYRHRWCVLRRRILHEGRNGNLNSKCLMDHLVQGKKHVKDIQKEITCSLGPKVRFYLSNVLVLIPLFY